MRHASLQLPDQEPGGSLLRSLGLIGFERIEPVILAALATETPMLLIGSHGTAKSLLLERLCVALDLSWRHYNASLINYDDLVGYPLPDEHGELRFVKTPASIWGAQAVFLDEISRARPDMQNRLFPIVHEKRVQGIALDELRFRWAAMNPLASDDEIESYQGTEPLDTALADRFGFVVEVPSWQHMSRIDQHAVIRSSRPGDIAATGKRIQICIESIRETMPEIEQNMSGVLIQYVQEMEPHLRRLHLPLSGRRAAMLYQNLLALNATQSVLKPDYDPSAASLLALEHSLPHRASGQEIDSKDILFKHSLVWKLLHCGSDDPLHRLMKQPNKLLRVIEAASFDSLSSAAFSSLVADAMASLKAGAQHALALFLMEHNLADRLVAAVAEPVTLLYGQLVIARSVDRAYSYQPFAYLQQRIKYYLDQLQPYPKEHAVLSNLITSQSDLWDKADSRGLAEIIEQWLCVRKITAPDAPDANLREPTEESWKRAFSSTNHRPPSNVLVHISGKHEASVRVKFSFAPWTDDGICGVSAEMSSGLISVCYSLGFKKVHGEEHARELLTSLLNEPCPELSELPALAPVLNDDSGIVVPGLSDSPRAVLAVLMRSNDRMFMRDREPIISFAQFYSGGRQNPFVGYRSVTLVLPADWSMSG